MAQANYQFQQHIDNILNRKTYSLTKVIPGNVIQFKYQAKIENPTDINPLVLVCNPNYNGELHGVNFNYLNEFKVQRLFTFINGIIRIDDNNTDIKTVGEPITRILAPSKPFFLAAAITSR